MNDIPKLYKKYYIDKNNERRELFRLILDKYKCRKGLYPGSFTHITPSFYFSNMTYVDTDKRCKIFYSDKKTLDFINKEKTYDEISKISFIFSDYINELNLAINSYDLLISLYSGFISKYCKQYLKKAGILIVNNSHGDAPLAYLDKDFILSGVIKRNGNNFKLSEKELNSYFITTTGKLLDKEKIEKTMKGPGYIKPAYAYMFRKV